MTWKAGLKAKIVHLMNDHGLKGFMRLKTPVSHTPENGH
jgi:hypothetical protein